MLFIRFAAARRNFFRDSVEFIRCNMYSSWERRINEPTRANNVCVFCLKVCVRERERDEKGMKQW